MFWFNIKQVYLIECRGCPNHVYHVYFNDALDMVIRNYPYND